MPGPSALDDYPRPHVAADIAVLTVRGGELCVVVQPAPGGRRRLPGKFVRERHTVEETVEEVLAEKLLLRPDRVHPVLLGVFSAPKRDPRAWTIAVAHAVSLPLAQLDGVAGTLAPIAADGALHPGRRLLYDHGAMVRLAAEQIRERYERGPDPDGLLPPPFTLTELRELHEAVLGTRLMRDTFNRRAVDHLARTVDHDGSDVRRGTGRPAKVYCPRPGSDATTFGWQLPRGVS